MDSRASPSEGGSATAPKADRKARLADELRANLQRRKAQARSRRTGEPDRRPDGLKATETAELRSPEHGDDAEA